MSFEDAYRTFTIISPRAGPRQTVVGRITDLDAFADAPNAQTPTDVTLSALIEIDLAENGGFVEVNNRDVIADIAAGVSYAIVRTNTARGKILLTVSQGSPGTATTPPQLPPIS